MKLSIIIVSYNSRVLLEECLESVFKYLKSGELDCEVFVVDNDSHDGSQAMVKNEFPDVNLIETGQNLGWARGNNRGIKMAKGQYILLLNPDTLILENSFEQMVNFIENNKEAGVLGPKLIDADGKTWTSTEYTPGPFMVFLRFCVPRFLMSAKIKNFVRQSLFRKFLGKQVNAYFVIPDANLPVEVGSVSGACLLIKKEVINQIGILDEKFFTYSDDIEWCLRAKKAGWKIIYFPFTKVLHYGGKITGGEHKPISFCHRVRSAYYYYKKHYNKKTVFMVRFLLFFGLIVKAPEVFYYFFKHKRDYNLLKFYFKTLNEIIIGKTL